MKEKLTIDEKIHIIITCLLIGLCIGLVIRINHLENNYEYLYNQYVTEINYDTN